MKEKKSYVELANELIENSKGIEDYCNAFTYANIAVNQGVIEAHYLLGQLYFYGTGCNRNLHRAKKHLSNFLLRSNEVDEVNKVAIEDAYFKLAEIEKKLKHFKNAYLCYQKLIELNPCYKKFADSFNVEIKESRKESFGNYFVTAGFVVAICICVAVINSMYKEYQIENAGKYAFEPKVIREEKVPAFYEPDNKVEIDKEITYTLISEEEFMKLNLNKINVSNIEVSSEYISQSGNYYGAKNLIDGNIGTTWQEGENDGGVGQSIDVILEDETLISGMCIINGKQTNNSDYLANNRLASFSFVTDDEIKIELEDVCKPQYIIFNNPILESNAKIIIESVYSGSVYNDTCISEIVFYE